MLPFPAWAWGQGCTRRKRGHCFCPLWVADAMGDETVTKRAGRLHSLSRPEPLSCYKAVWPWSSGSGLPIPTSEGHWRGPGIVAWPTCWVCRHYCLRGTCRRFLPCKAPNLPLPSYLKGPLHQREGGTPTDKLESFRWSDMFFGVSSSFFALQGLRVAWAVVQRTGQGAGQPRPLLAEGAEDNSSFCPHISLVFVCPQDLDLLQ